MRSLLLENTQDACVSPPPPPNQPKKSLCSLLIAASPPKKLLADSFTPSLTKAAGRTEEVRYGWVEGGEKKDGEGVGGGGRKEARCNRTDSTSKTFTFQGSAASPRLKHRLRCGERCGALLQLLLCFLCILLINPHRFKHTSPTQSHTSLLPHYPRCDPLPLPAFLCRCNLLWLMEHTKNAFLA